MSARACQLLRALSSGLILSAHEEDKWKYHGTFVILSGYTRDMQGS